MSRGLTTDLQNALRAQVVRAGYFVKMETTGDTVYLSTRERNVDWDGHTWLGNSWIRPTFNLGESVRFRANGISIRLAGIDPAAVSMIHQSFTHAKRAEVWLVAFNENGTIVADPYSMATGFFDNADIRDSAQSAEIVINYENEFIRGSDASQYRMTHFSQQSRYDGDLGFQYTAQVEDATFFWGTATRPKPHRKRKTKK